MTYMNCEVCGAHVTLHQGRGRRKYCDACRRALSTSFHASRGRYSGGKYTNKSERLEEIREYYSSGIPDGVIEEMVIHGIKEVNEYAD